MAETAGLAWRFGRVFGLRGRVVTDAEAVAKPDPASVAASSAVSAMHLPPKAEGAEFAGMRALVADDSEINCTILRTFLERLGFEVTLAADGVQALERWRPAQHELLCLDIEMPNMDGVTALMHMKAEAVRTGAGMPMALAVTINAMTHEVTTYLQAGFDACLPKPFSRNDLVDLLRRRWPARAA